MKTIIWISIMLAITLGAVFSSAKGTGRITGHVYDPATQAPVAGATVVVVGTQLTTHTGTDGAYTISNVPAGVYIVRAEKTGMPSLLQRISVNDGQTVTLDFGLVTVQDLPAVLESTTRKDEVKALERQRNSQPSMPQVPGSASVGKVKGM
ncbi:MAG: carboxypeptidase-like regulatory domain-containing protein, partial [Candidatus Krumholzibacteria bacterium]|nr:carboxypeptidase-like regulatory domain-containing protein [Candidatus Krumholzibacteria bacterium]